VSISLNTHQFIISIKQLAVMNILLSTYLIVGAIFSFYSIIRTSARKSSEYPTAAFFIGALFWPAFVLPYLADKDSVLRSDLSNLRQKLVNK